MFKKFRRYTRINLWPQRSTPVTPVPIGLITTVDVEWLTFAGNHDSPITEALIRFRVAGMDWCSEYIEVGVNAATQTISWRPDHQDESVSLTPQVDK